MHKKNKKWLIKVEMFCQQIRQGPYLICTVYRRSHYKHSVRLFEHEKYILTAQCIVQLDRLDHWMKKFIYLIHVINTFLELKRHVKPSSIK